jgi:hypothetical protein
MHKRNGFGIFTWNNDNVYEGNFENDTISGKGKMTNGLDGQFYEGEFKYGVKYGYGKESYMRLDGKIDASGKYTFEVGDVYEGNNIFYFIIIYYMFYYIYYLYLIKSRSIYKGC